jgi:hypothetical protein
VGAASQSARESAGAASGVGAPFGSHLPGVGVSSTMFTRQVNTLLLLCAAFAGGTVSATATTESEGPALADGHLAAVDRAALDGVPEPVLEAALGKIAQLGRQVASMQAEMKEDRVRTDKRAETLSGRVDELERLLAAGSGEPQRGAERQKNQTYVGQEQVEELQLDRRTRRRAQAAPACDLATQTAGLDACCSEMSGGGGHRRAQASCDLPVTCPSLECASIFLPFMADCDAMLSQMPGVQVAQFRSFAASCQQLQASVLQPVSVQMFRVRVNTEGAAQSGAMFPSTDSNGLPLLDLDLDPLHLDPLQPLPPPPPPLAEGGTGAIEQQQTECTSANLATCVPACNTDNHGYELLATIDGSDTKLACGLHHGLFSWVGSAVRDSISSPRARFFLTRFAYATIAGRRRLRGRRLQCVCFSSALRCRWRLRSLIAEASGSTCRPDHSAGHERDNHRRRDVPGQHVRMHAVLLPVPRTRTAREQWRVRGFSDTRLHEPHGHTGWRCRLLGDGRYRLRRVFPIAVGPGPQHVHRRQRKWRSSQRSKQRAVRGRQPRLIQLRLRPWHG